MSFPRRAWLGFLLVACAALAYAAVAQAVPIGVLSFDVLIPGPDGVNALSVLNLTGDPAAGGFALPPDFPVTSDLSLQNAGVTVAFADAPVRFIALGDLGPGPFPDPSGDLQFPETAELLSATFTASLSDTSLLLQDGSTFLAARPIAATLASAGGPLVPGADSFVLLEARPAVVPVPSPWPVILLVAGLAGLVGARRVRSR